MGRQEMHYVVKLLGQVGYFLVQVVHLKEKKNNIYIFYISFFYLGILLLRCLDPGVHFQQHKCL